MISGLQHAYRVLFSASHSRPGITCDRPLRIVMGIETLGLAGAEVMMFQLANELRERGHSVLPVGPEGRDGWLKDRFLSAGFPWHTYLLRRALDFGCAIQMAALFRSLRADITHNHEFTASVYGAAAARLVGIPSVITWHGNQSTLTVRRRRLALRWAIDRSCATVAVSGDSQRHLSTTLGLPPERVLVVRNGIPDTPGDRTRVRRELAIADNELLVLAVGTLTPRKAHRLLLDAMGEVDRRGGAPPWRVVIAGEGVERSALEAQIASLGLTGRASLLGNRTDIPDLQAAADIFVMPSLWEGLPLAVLEAMFAGTALIATTASGIPEAVTDGESGLLVDPGDSTAIGAALHRLLTDPALRESLGSRARARAKAAFSIHGMADAYETEYRAGLRAPSTR